MKTPPWWLENSLRRKDLSNMSVLTFTDVTKSYDGKAKVIDRLNFSIEKGEFITLIGPSGCGKTTLLKMINGLIPLDQGEIAIKNRPLGDWNLIKLRREIGYVIQQIGLFPHMTIEKNICYVLSLLGRDVKEQQQKAKELIQLVGLDSRFLHRYPRELSGGQKQRVGVARALAADPEIILMDEPFGAVDDITRKVLQDEMKDLHQKLKKTIVFVTHDIEEAIKLGTRIVLMDQGKIVQAGTKEEMLFAPKTEFTKRFLGTKSFNAYLGQLTIEEVYRPDENPLKSSPKDGETINLKDTVMEGIRKMIKEDLQSLVVINKEDKILGVFGLQDIQQKIER